MADYVLILFNGFRSSKLWWGYSWDGTPELRKLDFLDKLKKMGKVYAFNQPFFNVEYYASSTTKKERELWRKIYDEYKPHSPNINFRLEDLDHAKICEKTYEAVKRKYGDSKKYIVVGHSYGGPIALLFSKMYRRECALCCLIDSTPLVLGFYEKYDSKEDESILEKYADNAALRKALYVIRHGTAKERNKEIDDIYKLVGRVNCLDRIKYYDKKLYVPTIMFRAYRTDTKNAGELDMNKFATKEKRLFDGAKNLKHYVVMNDANHYIWKDQAFSDMIIETLRRALAEL